MAKTTSSRKSSPLSSDLEPKFCLASQLWILGTKSFLTTNFKQNGSRKPWTHVFLSLIFVRGVQRCALHWSVNHSYGIMLSLPNLSKKTADLQSSHPSESFNELLLFRKKWNSMRMISNAKRREKSEPNNASMRKTVHTHTHPIVCYKVIKQTNNQPNKQT